MNKKDGFVGILVASLNRRKYVLKQYLQHNTTTMKLFCFTPSSINWKYKSIIGLHRVNGKWVQSTFPFPRVVYNRCYDTKLELIERLGIAIGSNKCFNQINKFNKHEIHNHLNKWLVDYLPTTVPYDKESIVQLLELHKTLYIKPYYGNKGKGVYRVEIVDSGDIHISLHYFSPIHIVKNSEELQEYISGIIGTTPYIIQAGIDIRQLNHQSFDIRALIQKNENGLWSVTNLVSRIAYEGCYNTSICDKVCLTTDVLYQLYTPDKASAIIGKIYDICLRAAEIIDTDTLYHLGEFSVDLALDNDHRLWIVELNGKPQKDLYKGIHQQNAVYERPLQYAQYLHTL